MKYIDEYRNKDLALAISKKIHKSSNKPISIMEICGGQTHTILKYNLEEFLPEEITMIHGPGCPVCVSPVDMIDKAISLASREKVILASYGDMLRVPGSERDLLAVKADGGDVSMVYSPLDAVKIAIRNPDKKVVFFAIGFETTAPANAKSVLEARRIGLKNYYLLCSQMLVPPAIEALLTNNYVKIQGILAAGHVCTIMGLDEYELIANKYSMPIVATGFEPLDILGGIYMLVKQFEEHKFNVENQYSRAVSKSGNIPAKEIINKVFEIEDREWRGIGIIPKSGLCLKDEYSDFDALKNFDFEESKIKEPINCIAGDILQGIKKPGQCPSFGTNCVPEHPLGAPMVSSEGACSAYYRYRKL